MFTDGKLIEEHHGLATTNNSTISIAHMIAPPGWSEPFQTPEFDEYTYIISGKKQFIIEGETVILEAGQSIKIEKNTRLEDEYAQLIKQFGDSDFGTTINSKLIDAMDNLKKCKQGSLLKLNK